MGNVKICFPFISIMQQSRMKSVLIGILIVGFIMSVQEGSVRGTPEDLDEMAYDHRVIHVGGLGNANFSGIQDAIDAASPGDIIYVHPGVYYENIFIGKTVTLMGDHPLTTILDGSEGREGYKIDVIEVAADEVVIGELTLRNSVGNGAGVEIWPHYGYTSITNCSIYNTYYGISFYNSQSNYISGCTFYNNEYGFWQECCCGYTCPSGLIYRNNFTGNTVQAFDKGQTTWYNGVTGNYWSDYTGGDDNGDGIGDEPYGISGGDNRDYYPLIGPIDVIPPIVHVVFPDGGETLAGDITITWDAIDNHHASALKIDIEYRDNDETAWHTLAQDLDNTGEYICDTRPLSTPGGAMYSLKIRATDSSGNQRSDISNSTFTIISPPVVEVTTPLKGHMYIRNRELMPLPANITLCIGTKDVAVNASSEIGIERVEFYLDDSLVDIVNDEPYEWKWRSSFGRHMVTLIAYDTAENTNEISLEIWKFF
jgi:parallel beta-helix repeat protein